MTRSEIIREYERRIKSAGGYALADCERIARDTADGLDIPVERVRTVLMSHWGNLQG